MLENIWLKIVDLRGDILAALFCGCVVILILANGHMFYADEIPRPFLGLILAVAVITFFLWLFKTGMRLAGAIKGRMNARTKRLEALGYRALQMSKSLSNPYGLTDHDVHLSNHRAAVVSLFMTFDKEGIKVPALRDKTDSREIVSQWAGYLDVVGRLLAEGHTDQAKQFAVNIIEQFNGQQPKSPL